jgi:hypothetical protein
MLTRFLGGVAACVGAAGVLSAQQAPVATPTPTTTSAPQVRSTKLGRLLFPDRTPVSTTVVVTPPVRTLPAVTPAGTPVAVRAEPPKPAAKPAAPATPAAPKPLATPVDKATPPATPAAKPAAAAPTTPHTNLLTDGGISGLTTPCPESCPTPTNHLCCDPCGPPGRFWIDAGYWYGSTTGQRTPPLVTSAPAGTPRAVAGTIGGPGTRVLFPTGDLNDDGRSGFYLNAGLWLDQCNKCGIEGNFFFLGESRDRFTAGDPTGNSIITRPFTNTATGLPDTELVSFPGILAGSVTVDSRSRFIGGGPNFVKNLCCSPCGRFDLLLGYTYLNLRDEINIVEDLTSLPGQTNVPAGTRFLVRDNFRTSNNFHGVNLGVSTERRYSHWYVGARAGVALGVNHQIIDIDGSTTITTPGGTAQTFPGGLLTQPSNIGRYERDEFAVMPWVGLKVGCQLTPRVRTYVGYDFMHLSNVVRAGEQIDLRVNPSQIPPRTGGVTGPALPAFTPRETGVSLHAVRFGIEARY